MMDTRTWLLENDQPGVRYLACRDLLDLPRDDSQLVQACEAAHLEGAIPEILSHMHKDGYWVEPGPGYNPKYRSTVWSLINLAQLGASHYHDDRIKVAIDYILEHSFSSAVNFRLVVHLPRLRTVCRGTCARY